MPNDVLIQAVISTDCSQVVLQVKDPSNSAKCTGDPDADCSSTEGAADGLVPGALPPLALPEQGVAYYQNPEIGDYNGDGIKDVVWGASNSVTNLRGPNDLRFASVCPAAGSTLFTREDLCNSPLQIVFPNEDALLLPDSTTFDIVSIALAAGNFDGQVAPETGAVADELLIVTTGVDGSGWASRLHVWSAFDDPETLVPQGKKDSGVSFDNLKPGAVGDKRRRISLPADWTGPGKETRLSGRRPRTLPAATVAAQCR